MIHATAPQSPGPPENIGFPSSVGGAVNVAAVVDSRLVVEGGKSEEHLSLSTTAVKCVFGRVYLKCSHGDARSIHEKSCVLDELAA